MNKLYSLTLLLFFSLTIIKGADFDSDKFLGKWTWEKNSESSTFSIEIKKEQDLYLGNYCAIYDSGRKIDCKFDENEYSFSFNTPDYSKIKFSFRSYFSDTKGIATLELKGEKLYCEIINKPEGEYYTPDSAILFNER